MRKLCGLLLTSILSTSVALADPASVQVTLTAKGSGERLAGKAAVALQPLAQPQEHMWAVLVDPRHRFQKIEGIGGAITDASAETFAKLPKDRQQEVLDAYFDAQKGIGYSLGRTHIHSCDFSSHSYTYVKDHDEKLQSFSLEPDLKYRIPLIKEILGRNRNLKLFVSPWSPPAWMKSNNNMLQGGSLLPQYRQAWANYYVKFIQAYQKQGIAIWGLTVQNEPMAKQSWESCIYTAEEERDFVRDYLGPTLAKAGLSKLKLMIWDHNRGLMFQRASEVFLDPVAAKYVWGTAFHWYMEDHFENESRLHDAFPDKAIFFSEGCCDAFSAAKISEWSYGENYAKSMIGDFNNWTCGWTDWNILLDEQGGPNHVRNFCFAPIHADTRTGQLTYMSSYYYIGHFSKFIKPGARRIACTVNKNELAATAFQNPDGELVSIVMNATHDSHPIHLWCRGQAAQVELPAHSIATLRWRNK